SAQGATTARELGIPLPGTPGPSNAITDVAGVEVGHATIIEGAGPLRVGAGPVRTGVTAIFPRGRIGGDTAFAAWFALNGNGELTGTTWIDESGKLEGPVLITNTHSVGVVRDAVIEWSTRNRPNFLWALPVVGETYDGTLNDINGFHVRKEHAFEALDGARGGPVEQGNVGGGTGMICHRFKGGIGTSSRVLPASAGGYTVGVLVQCNYGQRRRLQVLGVPVGAEIADLLPCRASDRQPAREAFRALPPCDALPTGDGRDASDAAEPDPAGSIIIVVATDAPLLPHQLERVVRRAALGVGRMGGLGEDSSGDIFLAFSTANRAGLAVAADIAVLEMLPNDRINPIFEATVEAVEESILNAMLAAETLTGADDVRVHELPHDRLVDVLRRYGRMH
ncbi:MAG: P1 family peptidase, partial [Longimicrobiales bacterium]